MRRRRRERGAASPVARDDRAVGWNTVVVYVIAHGLRALREQVERFFTVSFSLMQFRPLRGDHCETRTREKNGRVWPPGVEACRNGSLATPLPRRSLTRASAPLDLAQRRGVAPDVGGVWRTARTDADAGDHPCPTRPRRLPAPPTCRLHRLADPRFFLSLPSRSVGRSERSAQASASGRRTSGAACTEPTR